MPILAPTFSLAIGGLRTSTDNPVAGPKRILVERSMDIPADAMQLHLMERAGIALGDDVIIALGHDGNETTVFTGNVVAVKPALIGVTIFALGKMNALLNLFTSTTFENQTAGSIARDLIAQAGLSTGSVAEGPLLPRFAVDHRLSGFAHLKDLADRLGYDFYADRDGKIMFHGLGPAANLDVAIGGLPGQVTGALSGGGGQSYAFGKHLLHAHADQQNAAWGAITVGGESPMSGQGDITAHWLTANDADYRGSAGAGSPALLIRDAAARYKDLAERFAAGRLAVAAREAHQVSIAVLGQPQLDLGDPINVNEVSDDLLNGAGYIRALRHRFGDGIGFVTDIKIS